MSPSADRLARLQSKRNELGAILTSRKRKLQEVYLVTASPEPAPQIASLTTDALSPETPHARFLEQLDLSKGRKFNEALLPRRHLRFETAKRAPASSHPPNPGGIAGDSRGLYPSRAGNVAAPQDGRPHARSASPRTEPSPATAKGQTRVPGTPIDGNRTATLGPGPSKPKDAQASKGSPTDLPADVVAGLDKVVDNSINNAPDNAAAAVNGVVDEKSLERTRIENVVESRPGSPGVDPRKAVPMTAEDAAQLGEPIIDGKIPQDDGHKAATVHLPPKEEMEARLHQQHQKNAQKSAAQNQPNPRRPSVNVPGSFQDGTSASSPSSTLDLHSATTPANHEASTDTSPEHDDHGDDPEDKDGLHHEPPSPSGPSAASNREKEQRDRLHKAQTDVSRGEILASSPTSPDAQLQSEEKAASAGLGAARSNQEIPDSTATSLGDGSFTTTDKNLTQTANEVTQDIVEDEDEVVGVPTPEDEAAPAAGSASLPTVAAKVQEIPDSNASSFASSKTAQEIAPADTIVVENGLEQRQSNLQPQPPPASTRTAESPEKQSRSNSSTPRRTPSASGPSSERMTTRVASGAIRHKSLSEILGEGPRPIKSNSERNVATKAASASGSSNSRSRDTTPQSPKTKVRSFVEKAKDKDRSKLSTVVFAKPSSKARADSARAQSGANAQEKEPEDYMMPLFVSQLKKQPPVDALLSSAHKTISTSNALVPVKEFLATKVVKRIYQLQATDRWSLRQPVRSAEPPRPTTHQDLLIQEMKWMQKDFRGDRKWKMAAARNLARACAEWVEANEEERRLLQVRVSIPPLGARQESAMDLDQATPSQDVGTPELIASAEGDTPSADYNDEAQEDFMDAVAPTAMFSLKDDDIVFGLRRSPTADKLLRELPLYGSPLVVPSSELSPTLPDPDRVWKRPALPLCKYVEADVELIEGMPPRKRSRYQYEEETDDEDDVIEFGGPYGPRGPHISHGQDNSSDGSNHPQRPQRAQRAQLEREKTDVALFNPENRHIRERIYAGHQFRPPSEFQMPLQSFFESRTASQWTFQEDDEVRHLVRQYSYNWSLISSFLTSKSMFTSGAERRTPWECFERWISLEGLPSDMQKTHYFRAYNNRIEQAHRNLNPQPQNPQPGQQPLPNVPIRRRSTTSVRVERRKANKHITLTDAMRKLAKKRETSAQKAAHAQGLAQMRKANENPQPRAPGMISTPQEFSKLKHDREVALAERMAAFQLRQEQARRQQAALMQSRQQQQGHAVPNGQMQQPRNPAAPNAPNPNGQPIPNPNHLAVPGQGRPHGMHALQNGLANHQAVANGTGIPRGVPPGMPPAPMQGIPGMQNQHRPALQTPGPDPHTILQAQRLAQEQRQRQIQMSQQHPGQASGIHNSPPTSHPNMNSVNHQAFMHNNQIMQASSPNNISTPPGKTMSGPTNGPAGSPRMGPPAAPPQAHNQIASLEAQVRAKYPNYTPEQHQRIIAQHIQSQVQAQQQQRQQLSQSAMHAAAGGANLAQNSPQMYAAMLRAQQAEQARLVAAQQQHQQQQHQLQQGQQQGQQQQPKASPQQQQQQQPNGQNPNHPVQQSARSSSAGSAGVGN